MKKVVLSFIAAVFFCFSQNCPAQLNIHAVIDTSFAHGGKVELSLGGFGDEITDFYGNFPDQQLVNKITVCGKIGTPDPSKKKFGLIRLKPNGTFDSTFADNGKAILSWGFSDYPNVMKVISSDNSIMIAGMSALSQNMNDHIPAVFRFKPNGTLDSTFGENGRAAILFNLESSGSGEFTSIHFMSNYTYLACGVLEDAFCAMRLKLNGTLDSSFGTAGKSIIPLDNHYTLSSVGAFPITNDSILFVGLATDNLDSSNSTVIFGRLKPNGNIDSSFGTNGILKTPVSVSSLSGKEIYSGIQPNYLVVVALPPDGISLQMPLRVVRFRTNGLIDSSYGTDGFVTIGFGPAGAKARGINIANNGKATVNGNTLGTPTQSLTARMNLDGTPDISFNQVGNAIFDIDNGAYLNYLMRFVGIGNKRYMGFGGSIHKGINKFLIARFKDDTLKNAVHFSDDDQSINIFPTPASNILSIESSTEPIEKITIIDMTGREVLTKKTASQSRSVSIPTQGLVEGAYSCIIETPTKSIIRKFLIIH
jgi:uncharacterized delta-60 repeat protein